MDDPIVSRSLSYTVTLFPQAEGGYTVLVPALPGAITEGDTLEEALAMARDVIDLMLDDYRGNGLPIPEDVQTQVRRGTLAA